MTEHTEIKNHYDFIRRYFPTTWARWQTENRRRESAGVPQINLEEFAKEKWERWKP